MVTVNLKNEGLIFKYALINIPYNKKQRNITFYKRSQNVHFRIQLDIKWDFAY